MFSFWPDIFLTLFKLYKYACLIFITTGANELREGRNKKKRKSKVIMKWAASDNKANDKTTVTLVSLSYINFFIG
jgi:hypothetical protein